MGSRAKSSLMIAVMMLVWGMSANAYAALASNMSLSASGPFKVNDTFAVRIRITGSENFSIMDGSILFSKDNLSVVSTAWSSDALSQFGIQLLDSPANANAYGAVSFTAITNEPSGIESAIYGNPVLTVTFRCIANGNAVIGNPDKAAWTLGDGQFSPVMTTGSFPNQTIVINGVGDSATCVPASNDLTLNFCAAYQGARYDVTLNYAPDPFGQYGIYWKMNVAAFRQLDTDPGNCVSTGSDLALSFCAGYQEKNYDLVLNYVPYPNAKAPTGFYWKLFSIGEHK